MGPVALKNSSDVLFPDIIKLKFNELKLGFRIILPQKYRTLNIKIEGRYSNKISNSVPFCLVTL